MKRTFDLVLSMSALVFLIPFFAVAGLLIKLDTSGPIFYRQKRIGKKFKPFYILKFRTMIEDADKKGSHITAGGDVRVTRVGSILRKTKIDELPQLINVLKGEMSFVGPRPEVEKYVEIYRSDYDYILNVRPGITDIASLTFRDEETVLAKEANPELYYVQKLLPQKIKLANDYIRHASFFYDCKLIILTIFKVVSPKYEYKNSITLDG